MKDLWRLLLPGMNVPACGVGEGESPADGKDAGKETGTAASPGEPARDNAQQAKPANQP